MDEEIRDTFQLLSSQIAELNSVVRHLQELTEEHRQTIKKLQQPMRDQAHVQPLS